MPQRYIFFNIFFVFEHLSSATRKMRSVALVPLFVEACKFEL